MSRSHSWYVMLTFTVTGEPVCGVWVDRGTDANGFRDGFFSGWCGEWWTDARGRIIASIDSSRFGWWFGFDGHLELANARARQFHSWQPQIGNGDVNAVTGMHINDVFFLGQTDGFITSDAQVLESYEILINTPPEA